VIEIAAKEFMCIGAKPPVRSSACLSRHGRDNEIICPYCSTLYRFPKLHGDESNPPPCGPTRPDSEKTWA
jgi:uncharacterized Zn-finger protein